MQLFSCLFVILLLSIAKCNSVVLYEKRCTYLARIVKSRVIAETKNVLTTELRKVTYSCANPITLFRCQRVTQVPIYKQIIVYKVVNEVEYQRKPCCCNGERRDAATDKCEPICTQTCQNNGICTRPGICSCTPSWEGTSCETDVNECQNSPCSHQCTNLIPGFECTCRLGYRVDTTNSSHCLSHTISISNFAVESESLTQARIRWHLDATFILTELITAVKLTIKDENNTTTTSTLEITMNSLTILGLTADTLYTFSIELIFLKAVPIEDRIFLSGTKTIKFHTPPPLMSRCLTYHNKRQREFSTSVIAHHIDPNPCNNKGECIDNEFSPYYACICPPGLTGQNCNELNDPCLASDCENGGTCLATPDRSNYTCICPDLYTGTKCSTRISACDFHPNLCLNSATCLDNLASSGGYECVCATGYIGRHCEVSYTYCGDKICLNDGECINDNNTGVSTCQCSLPFYGERCEITMEPCRSDVTNPCLNNGLCYSYHSDVELSEPFCACPGYAMGNLCEVTCMNGDDGEVCDCDTQGSCL